MQIKGKISRLVDGSNGRPSLFFIVPDDAADFDKAPEKARRASGELAFAPNDVEDVRGKAAVGEDVEVDLGGSQPAPRGTSPLSSVPPAPPAQPAAPSVPSDPPPAPPAPGTTGTAP